MTGAFDIVCELIPHIAIILYRVYPTSHLFLSRLFLVAAITTFFGTVCESLVIFYLFGSLWSQWQLAFKIVTPLLHCAFSATQFHGSRIFWIMWKKQERLLAEAMVRADEENAGGAVRGEAKEGPLKDVTAVEMTLAGATPIEVKREDVAEAEVRAGDVL